MNIEYPPKDIHKRLLYLGKGVVKDKPNNLFGLKAMVYRDPLDHDNVYAQFDLMDVVPFCLGLSKFKASVFEIEQD